MEKHPIENIMSSTMENLKSMIDVNTVIGQAVVSPNGATIIPVSCVGFGFVSGGGEFRSGEEKDSRRNEKEEAGGDYPFAGGSGAGVSVKPKGFLVLHQNVIKFLPIQQNTSYDRMIELIPQIISEIKDALKNGDPHDEENAHIYTSD